MERLFCNQFDDFEFIDFKPLTRGGASKCAPVTFETNNETRRVRFNNKQLCDFLARHAGVEGNFSPIYFELSEDLSNSENCATFKIKKLCQSTK